MAETRRDEGSSAFEELRERIRGALEAVGRNGLQGFDVAEHTEPRLNHLPMTLPPPLGRQRRVYGIHQRQHQRRQERVAARLDEIDEGGELR